VLRRNPTRGIELPILPPHAPRPLSGEQRSILRSLVEQEGDRRGAALFALGYWAGCRVSEVSWLQMVHTHVGPQEGWLHVVIRGASGGISIYWNRPASRSTCTSKLLVTQSGPMCFSRSAASG
jgi:site-specific recombinase XerC